MPGGGETRVRGGRRNGPLAGLSPEGDALAVWLREITVDRTLNELVAEFGTYKRASWGEFRNGHKPIPLGLLRTVVTSLITEPRRQGVELKRGSALHRAAVSAAAAAAKDRACTDAAPLPVRELQLRLDEARRGHIEVQRALLDNKDTIRVLEATITSLEDRCAQLEAERDRALSQAHSVKAVERDLEAFSKVLARTEQRLELALQDRGSAEGLLVDVRRRAEGFRRELQALQQAGPAGAGAGPGPEDSAGTEREQTNERTAPDARRQPRQWEYELLLETVDDGRETRLESLAGVRQRMEIADPFEQGTQLADVVTATVTVVHPHGVDSVDNVPDHRGVQAGLDDAEETSGADDAGPRPLAVRTSRWLRLPGRATAAVVSAAPYQPAGAPRGAGLGRRPREGVTARGAAPRWLHTLSAMVLIGLSASTAAPPLSNPSSGGDRPEPSPSVKSSEPVPPVRWTTALADFARLGPVSGGTQFVQDSKTLRAIDTTTGTTLWSKPAPGTTGGMMAFGDNTLYATDDSTTLQARNGTTGALRWSRDLASLLPAPDKGRRFFLSGMEEPQLSRTAPDIVFASLWNSQLTAPLSQATEPEPGIVPSSYGARPALCVANGCAGTTPQSFINASIHQVTAAVNSRTGAVIWQTDGELVTQAGQTCLVSDADGTRGVDCNTGTVHWSIDSDCDAAVVTDAGAAAVCTAHGFVYRIDVSTGRQAWESGAVPTPQGPPQAAHKTIYLTSGNGRLYALDQDTGKTRWSAAAGSSTSSPVPDRSQVYVAGADGRLYAFNAATGTREWSAPAGRNITTEPRVSGATVYVGGQDGRVYALNRATGDRRWSTSAGGGSVEALHTASGRLTTLTDQRTAQHR